MDVRGIERAWRLGWMRIIARMLPGPRTTTLPDVKTRPLKVLFLRYDRIGDMIMATGLIRALAHSSPLITVDVVAGPNTAAVLDRNPHVRKVFALRRGSWLSYLALGRQLAREHYDVIVDGRLNNPPAFTSTPLLMLSAGARYRVGGGGGRAGGNNDLVYNVRVKVPARSEHYVEGSKALAEPFGLNVSDFDWRTEIFLSDDEREGAEAVWGRAAARVTPVSIDNGSTEPRLLVNLSASHYKRRWGDENFIKVLRAVRAAHPAVPIVVIGLPADWDSVKTVAASAAAEAASTPQLREALALVATSDRVLTPDTSISHAASAFNKPEVVLLRRDGYPDSPFDMAGEFVFWDGDTIHGLAANDVVAAVLRLCSLTDQESAPSALPALQPHCAG
ncbi:MAG TPA: glycosyltransferase family 9 protein [Gemmatimonadaceae bacterium]